MSDYKIYWGDTHHNTYQHGNQDIPLDEILSYAATYLDFYTGAYYTPIGVKVKPSENVMDYLRAHADGFSGSSAPGHSWQASAEHDWQGVNVEKTKSPDTITREWAQFLKATAAWNRPGEFVAFPGYEWQGNGRCGDFNVTYKNENNKVFTVDTLGELYDCLRGIDAIAIPHHTGYSVGQRAPDWAGCDESISPYAELFSCHGCSETDEEWVGLRANSAMGPGVAGGTYQDALDRGLHIGAICSTDNWSNMPGHWGQGIMACMAKELTRDGLWEAFRARRVYGVTGDRIKLGFTCNGYLMGSIIQYSPMREFRVSVRGSDAIDRIEILRNGRVIAAHCHQGSWEIPGAGKTTRFKIRIEPGWGPRPGEIPLGDNKWDGQLTVEGGKMIGWEPCWVTRGQSVPQISGDTARFSMISNQEYVTQKFQGATVFEFEGTADADVMLRLNGLEIRDTAKSFADKSRLFWYRDECIQRIRETTGIVPETLEREDILYHMARKAKIHRAIPEAGYCAEFSFVDDAPLEKETNYRVRVEQRNGQRAWSSPIWVLPA